MSEPEPRSAAGTAVPTPAAPTPAAPTPAVLAAAGRALPARAHGEPGEVPADTSPDRDLGTGDDAVDEALRRLVGVGELDLARQAAVFEDVHGALRDRLADGEG